MEIVVLEPEDAEFVEDLANHHYPPTYPMSAADIMDNLSRPDNKSFCFGVEHEEKIVGYLMAWVDNTMVEGKRERVVLVDDIVLSNKARHQLFRLLQAMLDEMKKRGFGQLPIEGSARPSSSHTFMNRPEALERLGYELCQKAEYYDEDFEEELTWVRYEPIVHEDATIDLDDQLEISFGQPAPMEEDVEFEDEEFQEGYY